MEGAEEPVMPEEPVPEMAAGSMDVPQKVPEEAAKPPVEDPWYKNSKVWINLFGYVAVTMVLVLIKVKPEYMPKSDRAFDCTDNSLKYPTKQMSVQQRTLIISTVSILLMSVFISEGVYTISPDYFPQRDQEQGGDVALKEKVYLFINLVTSKLLYGYLGLVLTMNLTFQIQHLACGFRPTFLAVCNLDGSSCTSNHVYARFSQCRTRDPAALLDARMSFPSEFASISFFMTLFSSMIIERAISNDYFALKIAVQTSYIFWAIYVSSACVKDHRNHPIDVFAGAALGIVMALITDYLATYQDYQDMGYDPNDIMLNIQGWDDMDQPMMGMGEDQGMMQQEQGAIDYQYNM